MGILLRNWHLKLAAVALATALYTGLVFSGSFTQEEEPGVPIEGLNPPPGTVVLGTGLPTVDVLYRAAPDVAPLVDTSSFAASVDLSTYDLERRAQPQSLKVQVRALVPNVTVEDFSPVQVTVTLDEIDTKRIPVVVETGTVPEGLAVGRQDLSDEEVTARGASSILARADHALARVLVQVSAIDVSGPVALVAVGIDGEIIEPIELTPDTVTVDIEVQQVETNKTVPVRPDIGGTPAPGFALESLGVDPAVVTLRGLPEVLAGIDEILTEPISIGDASTSQTITAELTLPEGTRLADPGVATTVSVTATIGPSVSSRTFLVGVVCVGAGTNACLPGLEQLSVTLTGPGPALANLSASAVTPVLDVAGLGPGQHQVTPTLGELPTGVQLQAISPAGVPVTIEPPATPSPTPAP